MAKAVDSDTKTSILDAAERAFAEVGFEAASVRQIIAAAEVNLASVHYHFGSKDALIAAVFERRLGPLNQDRLERLDRIEAAHPKGRLPLKAVLQALILPFLQQAGGAAKGESSLTRLYGRIIAEPSEFLQSLLHRQFDDVMRRFSAAFERALPNLPSTALTWRIHFAVGATAHVMCDPSRMAKLTEGRCDPRDTDAVARHLITFLEAGFRGPVPEASSSESP